MKNYTLLPALFLCFPIAIQASPYMSGQIGSSCSNESDQAKCGSAARMAGGYKWDVTQKVKLGLESGFSFFERTYSASTYQPASMWYATPANSYLIEGNVHKYDIDVLGVFDFRITKKFDLFVKAGEGFQKRTFKSLSKTSQTTTSNAMGFKMGFGLGYDIINSINVNLEYAYEAGKNTYFINQATPSFGTFMLGLQYHIDNKQPL